MEEYQGQEEDGRAWPLVVMKLPAALPGTYAEMPNPAARHIKGEVDLLKGKVGVLKGKVGILKGKVGVLKGKVGILKGKVGILKGKVGVLKGKVGVLKGKVDILKGKVGVLRKVHRVVPGSVQHLHRTSLDSCLYLAFLPGPGQGCSLLKHRLKTKPAGLLG